MAPHRDDGRINLTRDNLWDDMEEDNSVPAGSGCGGLILQFIIAMALIIAVFFFLLSKR